MSGGLVIRLRPHEKFLINGAVVENGEKRAKLRIKSPDANILRLRDALHPNDVTTPVRRLYYTAQLAVTGDLEPPQALTELVAGLDEEVAGSIHALVHLVPQLEVVIPIHLILMIRPRCMHRGNSKMQLTIEQMWKPEQKKLINQEKDEKVFINHTDFDRICVPGPEPNRSMGVD